ncbi:CHAT domain-containing protein [Nostoc punctiforme]|uniref:CHAT domain-containing protein n=1 Tax=Nostoc punctiforme (strain ATCC 29133 / PCC 73102) TaxID=63737 RepID=B2JAK0_NOSP7|nr:CHAT domain-containing protein [Nostoc punctiforme]ACC84954.1 conserved hypothetical protein [Nostoc punctiforme PCC 73102]
MKTNKILLVAIFSVTSSIFLCFDDVFGQSKSYNIVNNVDVKINKPHEPKIAQSITPQTNQRLINELQELVRRNKKGIVLIQNQEEAHVFIAESISELVIIDLENPHLMRILEEDRKLRKISASDLLTIAREVGGIGVKKRTEENYKKAYNFYRFALLVATYYQDTKGIDVVSTNIWYLLQELNYHKRGKAVALRLQQDELRQQNQAGQDLAPIQRLVSEDSKALLLRLKQIKEKLPLTNKDEQIYLLLLIHRLAALASNNSERIASLNQMVSLAQNPEQERILLKAIIDEFAQTSILEVFAAEGMIVEKDLSLKQFKQIWQLYLKYRKNLDQVEPSQFLPRLNFALLNFQYLRSNTVRAGGSFGHRSSYIVSEFLQPIGRDLVFIFGKAGYHQEAMQISEEIRSRALVDWMGRTHPNSRLSLNPSMSGSVGEVYPASYDETILTAKRINAPLLIYSKDQYGYSVWLLGENGEFFNSRIENPDKVIDRILQQLPYASNDKDINALQGASRSIFQVTQKSELSNEDLDIELNKLYKILLPQVIQEGLIQLKANRIAIVTDNTLDFIPFSALRTNDGQYLIEKYEIFYLPSVTAQLLIEDDERVSNVQLPDINNNETQRNIFLIGNPLFSNPYTVIFNGRKHQLNFSRLPGTETEVKSIAELLNVKPILGKDANLKVLLDSINQTTFFDIPIPQKLPLLHIASHGILFSEAPEESFVALSEGKITARFLYENDPGVRFEMVILSSCQTALGVSHPDSTIGLSNAFLVAGANTVGSTLWQISDNATVDLMMEFYKELLQGKNVATALRQAQIKMIKNPKWRHPHYWASFKIIGSTNNPLISK